MSETTDRPPAVIGLDEDLTITFEAISIAPGVDPVTSITIVEPTAAQIAMWDNLEGTIAQIKAISVCASVPEAIVRKLRARPYMLAVRRIEAFLA